MKKNYYKFCDLMAQACGAFAVTALLLSILIIVELVYMSEKDHAAWIEIAKKTSHKAFAEQVPGGAKLMEMALAVK
jgi:hypothetical protein